MKSPCVDICKYKKPFGFCIACGLIKKESKKWKNYKSKKRKAILLELPNRLEFFNN